jgi:aspartate aminotransferase-like enzyme
VGSFGDRFAEMAQAYGARVSRLEFPWGSAADPEAIRDALAKDPEIKAVLVTHNETSTGVTNDLESISQVVKEEFDKLLLVDAVSSLGCVALPVDQWKCDMVGTACQKGLLAPPGLSIICVSPQAWEANKEAKMPRYYFDLATAQRYLERGQTPWTPNLPLFYGLLVAVDLLLEEGMGHVFERHGQIAQMTREGVKALGLELLADPRHASDTVTAVKLPVGVDGEQLTELLRLERNVVVAEGLGKLAGKIFRIGHMGHVKEEDIQETLDALSWALPKVGFKLGHSVPGLGR